MKVIKDLVCVGKDELKDAERAIKLAMQYKGVDDTTAEIFATIAKQKYDNATVLIHGREVSLIKEHKAKGKEVPAAMQAVWDWEHEQLMEEATEIAMMMKTYRGG